MSKVYKYIYTFIGMALVLALFQNCQKAELTQAGDSSSYKAGQLTPVESNENSDTLSPPEVEDAYNNDDGTASTPNPAPSPDPVPVNPVRPADDQEEPAQDVTGDYVCILEGPGKSVKLGLSKEGKARGQNKIPQVLCMTSNACLNIASDYFGVKGPELRGYCKSKGGNPHVTHITDSQLRVKIDELLNPAP